MKITTRKPLRNEKEFVRRIHHAGYHDVVVAQFGTWDETRQDSFFEKKWSNSHLQILVVDNESCGFATVEENEQEVCLVELVVHPEFQGQGIGTAYLVRLIDQAEKRAVPLRLQVLLHSRAVALYRRLGFQDYGKTETHLLMERVSRPAKGR